MTRKIQTFEVSLKAFILRDDKVLLVQEADTGYWELPGGRIDVGEERLPHADILAREIAEELGANVELEFDREIVTWVRQRPTDGVFQFIVGHVCRMTGGALQLSDEHARIAWHTPKTWAALEFPPLSDYPAALLRLWHQSRT